MNKLIPGKPVLDRRVKVVGEKDWDIERRKPEDFIMLVFYRRVHCHICRKQLTKIESSYKEFIKQGADILAVNYDAEDHARNY